LIGVPLCCQVVAIQCFFRRHSDTISRRLSVQVRPIAIAIAALLLSPLVLQQRLAGRFLLLLQDVCSIHSCW
jgi:hypothetical protein